ncbi:hypothetical protein PF003_g11949 [Phytophthora fragariae]|nr:hypothetical protein PF003_g11949 [Phytophthora fragariae]
MLALGLPLQIPRGFDVATRLNRLPPLAYTGSVLSIVVD